MSYLGKHILTAVIGTALAVSAESALAQITLTYSSWIPPQVHTSIWQANWAADIEKATGGRVKFQGLPKHPVAAPGTFDAVKDGLVDLSYVIASYTPARHVLTMMPELPGTGRTSLVNSIAYSRIHWKYFHKVGEYNGVHLIGVYTHGPGQMFTKKPINTLADFKGLKMRTGGGVSELVVTALGGSPIIKPGSDVYELLNSGIADGTFFPIDTIASFKLETVLRQATLFPGGLYNSAFGFFMNQDKWNKLSKQDQNIIEKFSKEYVARSAGRVWDENDLKGMEAMKKSDMKIVNADATLVKEVAMRSAPIELEWIKKASAKGVNAQKILAEFRAELEKVANEK
ncbi:MAG: TRAP transporter substrate-binding protein [Burkholderiales bacterium]|nr:TRAP transporter substrate-binding protein [Burkholderiales bacterium]